MYTTAHDSEVRPEARLGAALLRRGWTVATAESCTGGLVAHRLTDVPGSSAWVVGGVVTYSNAMKTALLGVPAALLETVGAVSAETARAMAEGALRMFAADLVVSVTGIAGPGGATPGKPVGLVCFCALARSGAAVEDRQVWPHTGADVRAANKNSSAEHALALLLRLADGP
jgi:PncC family amidohydrolase